MKMTHSGINKFRSSKVGGELLDEKNTKDQADSKSELDNSACKINDYMLLLKRGYVLFNDQLGEGTYSKVKRAYSKNLDCDVAIKIINRKIAPKDFLKHFLPRELEIIGNIAHPNICKFFDVLDAGSKVYVCLQLAQGGDLLEYIKKHKLMPESVAKHFFSQVSNFYFKNYFFSKIYLI